MQKKIQIPLLSLHDIQTIQNKKEWKRKRRLDYYWPQFAHIQKIKTAEKIQLKTVDK